MCRNTLTALVLCCALPSLLACGGKPAGETAPASTGGTVAGTVTYTGPHVNADIQMGSDPTCSMLHPEPVPANSVLVHDGKLADVFVYVKSGLEGKRFPVPDEVKTLDQKGCLYQPRVLGLQVGQKLAVTNSDSTLHNVHAVPAKNAELNEPQPFPKMRLERVFDKPEVLVPFRCDVHPWMNAFVGVVDNPYYAVTGADGSFSLANLPPGKYTIEAVHPNLGSHSQEITLAPHQTLTLTFNFTPGP